MPEIKLQPKGYVTSKVAAKFLGYKNALSLYYAAKQPWFKKRVKIQKLGRNLFFNLKDLRGIKK